MTFDFNLWAALQLIPAEYNRLNHITEDVAVLYLPSVLRSQAAQIVGIVNQRLAPSEDVFGGLPA